MGRAFVAAVVGLWLATFLAVVSQELAGTAPALAGAMMVAAVALALVIAVTLVVVWRRDSRAFRAARGASQAEQQAWLERLRAFDAAAVELEGRAQPRRPATTAAVRPILSRVGRVERARREAEDAAAEDG